MLNAGLGRRLKAVRGALVRTEYCCVARTSIVAHGKEWEPRKPRLRKLEGGDQAVPKRQVYTYPKRVTADSAALYTQLNPG